MNYIPTNPVPAAAHARTSPPRHLTGTFLLGILALAMIGCEDDESEYQADLTFSSLYYSPTDPDVGDQVTLTAVIINAGEGASTATTFEYSFEGQTYVGAIEALSASATSTITFTVQGTAAGTSTLTMTLDPGDDVDESNESNNAGSRTITWDNDDAVGDLSITDLTVSDTTLTPGATAEVSFVVYFDATDDDVDDQTVTWRLVREDDDSVALQSGSFSISGDGSYTKTITFEDEDGLGDTEYLIEINYGNTVEEDDTTNNDADFAITWSASG